MYVYVNIHIVTAQYLIPREKYIYLNIVSRSQQTI